MVKLKLFLPPPWPPDSTLLSLSVHLWKCTCWVVLYTCTKYIGLLKAYSQISYRGWFQKFENLNFSYLYIVLPLETHFPKGIEQKSFWGDIRAIFPKILVSENLFNTVVSGAVSVLIIMHNLQTKIGINWNFGNNLYSFISSNIFQKDEVRITDKVFI